MKIFGFYLFEDPPELKAYKDNLEREDYAHRVVECEGEDRQHRNSKKARSGREIYHSTPHVELSHRMGSGDPAKDHYNDHLDYESKRVCHKFNGNKYCYHTGKKIVKPFKI